MSDDANEEKRRARLRAMQERYQQQMPTGFAVTAPAANEPVAEQQPSLGSRRGRLQREARQQQTTQQAGGGLLQRLLQFLMETSPGDTPIAGMAIGERRLQQAMRWLEQRAKSSQGSANERVQRLLRFLTQDIPGEPMVAGVNIKRLQQLVERAEGASGADALIATASMGDSELVKPTANAAEVVCVANDAALAQAAVLETMSTAPTNEIAVLEDTLQRLREISHDLERRLDAARRRGDVTVETGGNANLPGISVNAQRGVQALSPTANTAPSASVPRPEADNWFTEFLE